MNITRLKMGDGAIIFILILRAMVTTQRALNPITTRI